MGAPHIIHFSRSFHCPHGTGTCAIMCSRLRRSLADHDVHDLRFSESDVNTSISHHSKIARLLAKRNSSCEKSGKSHLAIHSRYSHVGEQNGSSHVFWRPLPSGPSARWLAAGHLGWSWPSHFFWVLGFSIMNFHEFPTIPLWLFVWVVVLNSRWMWKLCSFFFSDS